MTNEITSPKPQNPKDVNLKLILENGIAKSDVESRQE